MFVWSLGDANIINTSRILEVPMRVHRALKTSIALRVVIFSHIQMKCWLGSLEVNCCFGLLELHIWNESHKHRTFFGQFDTSLPYNILMICLLHASFYMCLPNQFLRKSETPARDAKKATLGTPQSHLIRVLYVYAHSIAVFSAKQKNSLRFSVARGYRVKIKIAAQTCFVFFSQSWIQSNTMPGSGLPTPRSFVVA